MPSPVGHAVAGLIVALAGERRTSARRHLGLETRVALRETHAELRVASTPVPWTLYFVCMVLAALPDLDYLYPSIHRGPTHSIGAAVFVTLIAAAVTRATTGRVRWRIAVVCGLAYVSHIAMDWLGEDPTPTPGLQVFWPLTDRLFLSGWDLFRSAWRIDPLAPTNVAHNAKTLAKEMALLGPILLWLLWRRRRSRVT